ncbi:TadE/TadG family type IV pilus assembly protein [Methylobacterium nonmethylotrophicum]|uniref:von willebrand factor type a n=1 Tax=Methylobacterium nonmethylotrophicum TaxID=1141884 RepID=A0A4Z0NL23_9HYPH|nr:TadE/TadG family type IV pilus assembly protein [Methylobacterium nonmethylotrophicum]TGD97156.1 von willebrand factor type a [Methylobacterium nonmethylotrophicum]
MARRPDAPAPQRRPRAFARLQGHRGGNVTILFAFLVLPMLMMSGAALDYGLATRLETKLQAATDATALLLCQTPLTATTAELNALAVSAMTGQMGAAGLVVDPLTIGGNPRQILLKTHKVSTAFFGAITGTRSLNPGAQAQCATPVPKAFEIALVLDNTGSMNSAGNDGVTKLAALKSAAKKFVSYVLTNPNFSAGTKIAIVPFSASVAVDPNTYRYADWVDTQGKSPHQWGNFSGMAAAGFTSRFDVFAKLQAAVPSWKWAGCFESLPYPQNVTDMATTGNPSLYMPYLAPDEGGPGVVGNAYWNGSYSINSYIDDDDGTTDGSCPKLDSTTAFATAEARACKYNAVRNPKSGAVIAELGRNGPNFGCTTQPLQRLTRDNTVLATLIDNMVAAGITNIHEGLMWGWRTISPKSVFADGTAYTNNTVGKIIVLMTDGENTWLDNGSSYNRSIFSSNRYFINADGSHPDIHFPSSYQNVANGTQARNALDELTRQGCQNAKANPANVTIYTIGFSVSSDPIDQQGINLLKACASSPSQYFQANDSGSLIAAFNQIAASIGKLRLTR